MLRHYSNSAPPTQLIAGVSNADSVLPVASTSGFPATPFVLCVERGTPNEETCLCTSVIDGGHFQVTRGYDSMVPVSHTVPSAVEHVTSASDLAEPNQFINLMSAEGDMIVFHSGGPNRFPSGQAGYVLTANGPGNPLGWQQPASGTTGGGGGGTPVVIAGEVRLWAGSSAPGGWQLCDGTALPRASNQNLFNAIGTLWGKGDGSTTFNVPDLRGKAPIGAGAGNILGAPLTVRPLASIGGEEFHTLQTVELPAHQHGDTGHTHPISSTGLAFRDTGHTHPQSSHTHGASDGGHSHASLLSGGNAVSSVIQVFSSTVGLSTGFASGSAATFSNVSTSSGNASINVAAASVSTPSGNANITSSGTGASATDSGNANNAVAGSNNPHNNMQPWAAINYIIALG